MMSDPCYHYVTNAPSLQGVRLRLSKTPAGIARVLIHAMDVMSNNQEQHFPVKKSFLFEESLPHHIKADYTHSDVERQFITASMRDAHLVGPYEANQKAGGDDKPADAPGVL